MCITNVYVDRYPDGRDFECRQTVLCALGRTSQPCSALRTVDHEPRRIQYGELSTAYMLNHAAGEPSTPPRTPGSPRQGSRSRRRSFLDGSPLRPRPSETENERRRRRGGLYVTEDGRLAVEVSSSRRRRQRERDRERVVVVDTPPTPRASPRIPDSEWDRPRRAYTTDLGQSPPSPRSPRSPAYIFDAPRGRPADRRPIIIDERRPRTPSVETVMGPRPTRPRRRSRSRSAPAARRRSLSAGGRVTDAARLRAQRIGRHNDEILNRPAVPRADGRRPNLRPVVTQSERLHEMMGDLDLAAPPAPRDRYDADTAEFRRREERNDTDDMLDRLRERQAPRYTYTFGGTHAGRPRTRVIYDNGVYRWE